MQAPSLVLSYCSENTPPPPSHVSNEQNADWCIPGKGNLMFTIFILFHHCCDYTANFVVTELTINTHPHAPRCDLCIIKPNVKFSEVEISLIPLATALSRWKFSWNTYDHLTTDLRATGKLGGLSSVAGAFITLAFIGVVSFTNIGWPENGHFVCTKHYKTLMADIPEADGLGNQILTACGEGTGMV